MGKETEAHKLLKKRIGKEFKEKGYVVIFEETRYDIYYRPWLRVDVAAYKNKKGIGIEYGNLCDDGRIMDLLTLFDKVIWQPYITTNLNGFRNTTRVEAEQHKKEVEDYVRRIYGD